MRWSWLSIPNLKGCTVEVWERITNFIPHFIMGVITYPFPDLDYLMFVKGTLGRQQQYTLSETKQNGAAMATVLHHHPLKLQTCLKLYPEKYINIRYMIKYLTYMSVEKPSAGPNLTGPADHSPPWSIATNLNQHYQHMVDLKSLYLIRLYSSFT